MYLLPKLWNLMSGLYGVSGKLIPKTEVNKVSQVTKMTILRYGPYFKNTAMQSKFNIRLTRRKYRSGMASNILRNIRRLCLENNT